MTLEIWAHVMLRASLQGAMALGLVWGICLLVGQKTPGARCWLWRLGYGKFALALLALAPLNVPLLPPASPARTTVAQHVASAVALPDDHSPSMSAVIPADQTATVEPDREPSLASIQPVAAATAAPHASLSPPPAGLAPRAGEWWQAALLFAWLAGVLFCILRLAPAWRHTAALRRTSTPLTAPELQQMAAGLTQRLGLRRPPVLLAVERDGPLLTGVLRPAILLPRALLQGGSPEHLRLVLAHELAHLKRHDLFWNSLQAVIETAFFFHPLLWLARAQTRAAQELACDALALQVTHSSPAAYGKTLLDVLELQQLPHRRLLGAGVAASAISLKRRILAMKNLTPGSRKRMIFVGTLLACGGALALLPWRVVAQNAPAAGISGPATAPPARAVAGTTPADKIVTQTIPIRFKRALQDLQNGSSVPGTAGAASVLEHLKTLQLIGPGTSVAVAENQHALVLTGPAADVHRLAEIIGAGEFDRARSYQPTPADMPAEVLVEDGRVDVPILDIEAPVDGAIKEVAVRDGQQVKKGTVLFKLDDRAAMAALEMAKLTLQNAELAYHKTGDATTEGKMAQNQVVMDEIQLKAAQDALDDLTIRAPQDGIVEEFDNRPGQLVTKGARLASIVDVADRRVSFSVPPEFAARITVGKSFTLCPTSGPAVTGEVTSIWPTVTPQSNMVQIRGEIVSGDHLERFLGGMIVTIYVTPAPLSK